jgi:Mannosylglycerate hydrolase MGH1-like glycoside hydrolase domain
VGHEDSQRIRRLGVTDILARVTTMDDLARTLQALGLKQDPQSGLTYYSGYGDVLYDWELYFAAILLACFGLEQYAWNNVLIMLGTQKENGFIPRYRIAPPRSVDQYTVVGGEEHFKPFLFQIAHVLARLRQDASWLTPACFAALRRYLDHWLLAWDDDGNGLSEWSSAPHSGCDTQFERAGYWRSRFCEGVDLNCYLYRECVAAATLAEALGAEDNAVYFTQEAERKKERIQSLLWDEHDGFFYDRDVRTGDRIRVKSGAGFMPLWAGIASAEQAQRLVKEHLTNPDEFWTAYPIASYARSEPRYTQFYEPPPGGDPRYVLRPGHCGWTGCLWPHYDYPIAHGLQAYGYHDEASQIAMRFRDVVERDPAMHEWYDAETGEGRGMTPFCAGVTVLGLFLSTELAMGADPTRLDRVAAPLQLVRSEQLLHGRD